MAFLTRIFFILILTSVINCIGMKVRNEIFLFDSATLVKSDNYVVLGPGTGQDSAFFFLGMFPVTKEPNVELAMSQALEKYPEGRTLINIQIVREDRPYFPLGLVTVVIVTADVIGEPKPIVLEESPRNGNKP